MENNGRKFKKKKEKKKKVYLQLTLGDSFPGAGGTSEATGPFPPRPQRSALLELPRPGGHCSPACGGPRQSRSPRLSPFHRLVLMVKSEPQNCLCSGLLRMREELLFA